MFTVHHHAHLQPPPTPYLLSPKIFPFPTPADWAVLLRRCILIDDSADNVAAAKEAGWQGLVFTDAAAAQLELKKAGVRFD